MEPAPAMPEPESPPALTSLSGGVETATQVRVAIFSDSLSERNGTGAYYHDLAGQLSPRVGALEVFQPRRRARFPRLAIKMPGDPTQKVMCPDIFRIGREFKQLRPNVVVSVTPGPFGLWGMRLAHKYKTGFIHAFHTQFEGLANLYWNRLNRRFILFYLTSVNRALCKKAALTLINNSELAGEVEALGAQETQVMGTPVQSLFLDTPLRPIPERIEQICFAGRLAAEKNIGTILDAAEALPSIRFKIAGDGPLRKSLGDEVDKRALANIEFLGWMNREQLVELIDSSSLLLLPSHLETFGSVALEAMARGRPALVAAAAGIHDWKTLAAGLFTFKADESLAEAIRPLLKIDGAEWRRRSAQARQAAVDLNTLTIQQWTRVLAGQARPRP